MYTYIYALSINKNIQDTTSEQTLFKSATAASTAVFPNKVLCVQ